MNMRVIKQLEDIGIYNIGDPSRSKDDVIKQIMAEDSSFGPGPFITPANQGVPGWMATYVSPKIVEIITAKRGAAELAPISPQGDWTTAVSQFAVSELTGNIATYSDFGNGGMVGDNYTWEYRQAYNFQVIMSVGDKEQATQALARINTMDRKQRACADILSIATNALLLYGVDGIPNYGFLNDPSLLPAIPPSTAAAGGTKWEDKTALEQFKDLQTMIGTLIKRSGNRITAKTPLKLACSGEVANLLTTPTQFGLNTAYDLLSKEYSVEIINVPECDMAAMGQLVRIYAERLPVIDLCVEFGVNHLMRGFGMVRDLSSVKQKYSSGTFGAYYYAPFAVVDMIVG